jgi:hypothetical protein
MAARVHKLLKGEGAERYLPFALQKAESLHRRARGGCLSGRWQLGGGEFEVSVRVTGEDKFICIAAVSCPGFLSGFMDLVDQPGDGIDPIYTVPDPDDPTQTIQVLRRFYPSPTQAEGEGIAAAWRDEPGLTNSGLQAVGLKASQFSGEMRKVAQILQGQNKKVYYSPTAAITHGVFKASTGKRWVIQISNQGVAAWPLGMCRAPIRDRDGGELLDYTPAQGFASLSAEIAAAQTVGSYIQLLPPAGVLEFYSKSPLFVACGWAFSGTGAEAANISVVYGVTVESFLYKIQIIETDGRPSGATLAQADYGQMAVNDGICHMKYPLGVQTAELFPFVPYGSAGPLNSISTDAPVHCYYEGEVLQVYRIIHNPSLSIDSQTDLVRCRTACGGDILVGPNESGAPFRASGAIETASTPHFTGGGSDSNITSTMQYAVTYRTHFVAPEPIGYGLPTGNAPCTISANCSAGTAGTYYQIVRISKTSQTLNGNEFATNVLVVPAYDREAVYLAGRLDRSPVLQTSASYQDGLFNRPGVVVDSNCFSPTPAEFKGTPDTCCATIPIRTTRATLTTDLDNSAVSLHCSNGVTPLAWDFISFTDIQGYYAYGNSVITACDEFSVCDCNCVHIVPFTPTITSDSTSRPIFGVETRATYFASGNLTVAIDLPDTPLGIPDIFTPSVAPGQNMISIRDAFNPKKYIISPDIWKTAGSVCLTSLTDYPVREAGNTMALVGVS